MCYPGDKLIKNTVSNLGDAKREAGLKGTQGEYDTSCGRARKVILR
jgi:hypothetical protein